MNVANLTSFISNLSSPTDTVIIRAGRGMGVISSLVNSDVIDGPDNCVRYMMLCNNVLADLLDLPYYADRGSNELAKSGGLFVSHLPSEKHLLIIDSIDDCDQSLQDIVISMARDRMVGETSLPDNCRIVLLDFGNTDYDEMSLGWRSVFDRCHQITID